MIRAVVWSDRLGRNGCRIQMKTGLLPCKYELEWINLARIKGAFLTICYNTADCEYFFLFFVDDTCLSSKKAILKDFHLQNDKLIIARQIEKRGQWKRGEWKTHAPL